MVRNVKGHDRVPTREDTDVLGERIGAWFVDGFVALILAAVVWLGVGVFLTLLVGSTAGNAIGLLFGFGAYLWYFFLIEGMWDGYTVGKKLFGIKVVKVDGSECGLKASFMRNLLHLVDGMFSHLVGLWFISSSDRNQRLGDQVADTVVVKEPPETGRRGPPRGQRARRSPGRYEEGTGRRRDHYEERPPRSPRDDRGRGRNREGYERDREW